jgi:hypothetical protein
MLYHRKKQQHETVERVEFNPLHPVRRCQKMLNVPLFEQRRAKVIKALERAKMSMMTLEDSEQIRPYLAKGH